MASRKPAVANTGEFEQLQAADDLGLANSSVLAVKTLTFNGEIDDGNSGATKTIDFSTGLYHKVQMTAACTFTFTTPTGPSICHLKLTQDVTGGWAWTLPSGKFPGDYVAADKLLSTAASAVDLLVAKWDGAAWWFQLSKAWA